MINSSSSWLPLCFGLSDSHIRDMPKPVTYTYVNFLMDTAQIELRKVWENNRLSELTYFPDAVCIEVQRSFKVMTDVCNPLTLGSIAQAYTNCKPSQTVLSRHRLLLNFVCQKDKASASLALLTSYKLFCHLLNVSTVRHCVMILSGNVFAKPCMHALT